jgi:hypothetical protein
MTRDQRAVMRGDRVSIINRGHLRAVEELICIGPADACGVDFQEQLALSWFGLRHFLDANVSRTMKDCSAHFALALNLPYSAAAP